MFKRPSSAELPNTDDLSGDHWIKQAVIGIFCSIMITYIYIYIMPKGMKSYQKTKITWTQRTAALWPSNLWIGDPTPLEVRLRRSNMRTELSADLERYGDKLNVDVMLCHPAHKDMTWISRQKRSSYPVRIRLSSWGFQSTQWRSALWAFSTCHQIHGREEN